MCWGQGQDIITPHFSLLYIKLSELLPFLCWLNLIMSALLFIRYFANAKGKQTHTHANTGKNVIAFCLWWPWNNKTWRWHTSWCVARTGTWRFLEMWLKVCWLFKISSWSECLSLHLTASNLAELAHMFRYRKKLLHDSWDYCESYPK